MRVVVTPSAQDRVCLNEQFPWRSDDIINLANGFDATSGVTRPRSFAEFMACLPEGWSPDAFLLWSLEYTPVPAGVEEAGCLTAAVVGDWNVGGQAVQLMGGAFDLLIADRNGCERLQHAGCPNVRYAPLWSFDPAIHRRLEGIERDIDILMVGSFNHDIQHDRAKWLARVAKLSRKYKVCLTSGVHGEEYTRLMNQAKIVFNRSIRGEINMRAYEAPACGALLFYERENPEIQNVYRDREECVLYGADDLEELLAYYLEHEEERARIAEAGWRRVQQETTGHHFARILDILEEEAGRKDRSARARFVSMPPAERALRRLSQWVVSSPFAGSTHALAELPTTANLLLNQADAVNAEACAVAIAALKPGTSEAESMSGLRRAADMWRLAVAREPSYAAARLNLAHALHALGDAEQALVELDEALAELEREDVFTCQVTGPYFPRRYDAFDVEMEAAWSAHPEGSQAWVVGVRDVLLWRAYELRAELTAAAGRWQSALEDGQRAVRIKPHIARTRLALARVLRQSGRCDDAVAELREAYVNAPLCAEVWLELLDALQAQGQRQEATALAAELLALIDGCPPYESLRAQVEAYVSGPETNSQAGETKTYLCFPDWEDSGTWAPIFDRYAHAFSAEDDSRLVMWVDASRHPRAQEVAALIEARVSLDLRLDLGSLPDVELLHLPPSSLSEVILPNSFVVSVPGVPLPPEAVGFNLPIIPVEALGPARPPAARTAA